MVMQELPEPRPTFVLKRGAYDARGETVNRGVPAVLPPIAKAWPNDRLGLARWIVSPDNPLTARVTVNRFWQMLFGTGLVKTAEDFGAQGKCLRSRVARLAGTRVSPERLGCGLLKTIAKRDLWSKFKNDAGTTAARPENCYSRGVRACVCLPK